MQDPELEAYVRLGAFGGILVVMAVWEVLAPRRVQTLGRRQRWPGNLGIVVINTLLARVVFPAGVIGVAVAAEEADWGLLALLDLPLWASAALSVVVLDLVIYLQHVMFHAVPALWRLHRMHHADVELDVTSGARFHPVEILMSVVVKLAAVAALGAPAIGVLIFEVLLNGTAMLNHGNVRIPLSVDRILRWFVVTPDMHRVHHSVVRSETDSNFGFNLPWWDKLMGTYQAQPKAGHEGMTIGLESFREPREQQLHHMLSQPFRDSDR